MTAIAAPEHPRPIGVPYSRTLQYMLGGRRPDVAVAKAGLVICTFYGFGVQQGFAPLRFFALLALIGSGVALFGPRGSVRRTVLNLPTLLIIAWWTLSRQWTFNTGQWLVETRLQLALTLVLVLIASVIEHREVMHGLVIGCYVSVWYTLVYTAMHPATTTVNFDGTAGWHGAFVHKNSMAPCMTFAVMTLVMFDRRRPVRDVTIAIGVALVLLSQSTTSLAVALVLLPTGYVLMRMTRSNERTSRVLAFFAGFITLTVGVATAIFLPVLLRVRGKDLTLSSRTQIWSGVWRAIEERPWSGYGVGGVWSDPSVEPTRSILDGLGFTVFHAHNGFLELWLQVGLIGLVLFAILITTLFFGAVRVFRASPQFASYSILFILLVLLTSLTEVAATGIWLSLTCAFLVMTTRERASQRRLVSPRLHPRPVSRPEPRVTR